MENRAIIAKLYFDLQSWKSLRSPKLMKTNGHFHCEYFFLVKLKFKNYSWNNNIMMMMMTIIKKKKHYTAIITMGN